MTFAVRRARQQVVRLVLVLLAGLFVVLGVGGMEVLSARLVDDGVQRMADHAEPSTRVATVTALRAEDPAAQDRAVRAAIDGAFGSAPVSVSRIAVSDISVGNPDAVQAMSGADVPERGVLVDGSWPSRTGEAAVLATAAKGRGWRLGDRIRLGVDAAGAPVEVAVVGIWRAADPADPAWAGDPAVASGQEDGAAGPVLIVDEDMARVWTTPTVTWTARPTAFTAERLDAYREGQGRMAGLPATVDPESRANTVTGDGLIDLIDRATRAVTVTRGTMVVPVAIIVLLGAIATVVMLTALAAARRDELGLQRARGAAVRGIAAGAAAEAAIAAGSGAAIAILVLLPFGPPGPAALVAAALTVLVAGAAASLTAARASAPGSSSRSDAGRGIVVALLVPAFVVTALAGFAFSQLIAQGGVLAADGSADPVASASGAASLLALALLVPVLAVLIAGVAERGARRLPGILPVLPLRQIARRAGVSAVAILCAALAAGSVAVALGAAPLAAAADRAEVRAGLGLDVRVAVGAQRSLPMDGRDAGRLPSVTHVTEVLSRDAEVGSDRVPFVGADEDVLGLPAEVRSALGRDPGGALPVVVTEALARRLGATAGTRFTATLRPEGIPVPAAVVAIVPSLPGIGSGPGFLADRAPALRIADGAVANELWLAAGDPTSVAAAVRERATAPITILTPGSVSSAPVTGASVALLGVGALTAGLLGLLGFLAATAADRSRRSEERLALRALGLSPARQRSARAGEVLAVALFGAAGGLAAGFIVTVLVLPAMWRAVA